MGNFIKKNPKLFGFIAALMAMGTAVSLYLLASPIILGLGAAIMVAMPHVALGVIATIVAAVVATAVVTGIVLLASLAVTFGLKEIFQGLKQLFSIFTGSGKSKAPSTEHTIVISTGPTLGMNSALVTQRLGGSSGSVTTPEQAESAYKDLIEGLNDIRAKDAYRSVMTLLNKNTSDEKVTLDDVSKTYHLIPADLRPQFVEALDHIVSNYDSVKEVFLSIRNNGGADLEGKQRAIDPEDILAFASYDPSSSSSSIAL